ncbi:MAG: pirin family protein [bacterium]|nr:pirin family protein [bacterium]
MITVYPFHTLGQADYGWLRARYHFSFASYHNPKRIHFGALRVINDDIVSPGHGFDTHPHDNMEIITYVRKGAITHKDSMGNEGRTAAGDLQVMSAGSGILHSEHNRETEDTQLYQIWIFPEKKNIAPRWETRSFPKTLLTEGPLPLLVSGNSENSQAMFINQRASIYGGNVRAGAIISQNLTGNAYILTSKGEFTVNNTLMTQGDGAEATGETKLDISAKTDCEMLIIEIG